MSAYAPSSSSDEKKMAMKHSTSKEAGISKEIKGESIANAEVPLVSRLISGSQDEPQGEDRQQQEDGRLCEAEALNEQGRQADDDEELNEQGRQADDDEALNEQGRQADDDEAFNEQGS
jgi:hypothetical protein